MNTATDRNRRRAKRAAALVGASALVLACAAAPAVAKGDRTTIHYLSTYPTNTDIDLGVEGPTPGDRQVFVNEVRLRGGGTGYESGEALITEFTDTGLKGQLIQTVVLPKGSIAVQAALEEVFAEGPSGYTGAVVGGTGKYRGASGEVTARFVSGTDNVKVTVHLD